MEARRLNFEYFDGRLRYAAEDALAGLHRQERAKELVPVTLDPQLASVLAKFLSTALERGGIAYVPLGMELSPNEASKILGLSRPLVVRRMKEGQLPFHYVGTHRRCTLEDVLRLKAEIDAQNKLMTKIYENFEEIGGIETGPTP